MLKKNEEKNTLLQESVLDINKIKAIKDNKKEKKPEIELTDVNNIEDNETYKFIDSKSINDRENKADIKVNKCDRKKLLIELIFFIMNCLSFLFYYLSLEGCFLAQDECIPLLASMFIVRIIIFGALAALLLF